MDNIDTKIRSLSWKVSIADGKSEHLCFHLVFKMAVSLPAQFSTSSGILWN